MEQLQPILTFFFFLGGVLAISVAATAGFRRFGRKPVTDTDSQARLGELEARLAELEERVDFTERALADVRTHAQIPPKNV
jgi:hypothetical protein